MHLAQLPTPIPIDDGGFFGGFLFLLLVFLAVPLSFAFFTAWLAEQRGHTRNLWFVLGFFFGPVAMLALGFAPARGKASDAVVAPGSLGEGAPVRLSSRSDRTPEQARAPIDEDELLPPPPPPPARPAPRAPAYDEPFPSRAPVPAYELPDERPSHASVEIDVDGAVFHEGTNRAYGRGLGPDGSVTYFVIPSRDKLQELSDALRVSRPVREHVPSADVVPIESLPTELQR
jgi:hypothetical protein